MTITARTTHQTGRVLGHLDVEGHVRLENPAGVAGTEPSRTDYRPVGVGAGNDGYWGHWMRPGWTYGLRYDTVGWLITAVNWTHTSRDGHTYRLVTTARDAYTDQLSVDGQMMTLDAGSEYELRADHDDVWLLVQL